jgi:hypothetical protein
VAHLFPQALGSLFVTFYNPQGYGGGILTHLQTKKIVNMNGIFWRSVKEQETELSIDDLGALTPSLSTTVFSMNVTPAIGKRFVYFSDKLKFT